MNSPPSKISTAKYFIFQTIINYNFFATNRKSRMLCFSFLWTELMLFCQTLLREVIKSGISARLINYFGECHQHQTSFGRLQQRINWHVEFQVTKKQHQHGAFSIPPTDLLLIHFPTTFFPDNCCFFHSNANDTNTLKCNWQIIFFGFRQWPKPFWISAFLLILGNCFELCALT